MYAVGLCSGNIRRFVGVGTDVKEFGFFGGLAFFVDQFPIARSHAKGRSSKVPEDRPFFGYGDVACEQGPDVLAIPLGIAAGRVSDEIGQGWHPIGDVQGVKAFAGLQMKRPVDQRWRADTAFVELRFLTPQGQVVAQARHVFVAARVFVRVVKGTGGDGTVVRGEDDDGVFALACTGKRFHELADGVVHLAGVRGVGFE